MNRMHNVINNVFISNEYKIVSSLLKRELLFKINMNICYLIIKHTIEF